MLRQCQSLKHRTLHKMVDSDQGLYLIFVLLTIFLFLRIESCLMFGGPFEVFSLSKDVIERS